MISRQAALRQLREKLGETDRAKHSQRVGEIMAQLAVLCNEDADLWEIVGICHDLDVFETKDDRSRHGLSTRESLESCLPQAALNAIAAHDHRTGIAAEGLVSISLRAADALERLPAYLPADSLQLITDDRRNPVGRLRGILPDRPWVADLLEAFLEETGVAFADLMALAPSREDR